MDIKKQAVTEYLTQGFTYRQTKAHSYNINPKKAVAQFLPLPVSFFYHHSCIKA